MIIQSIKQSIISNHQSNHQSINQPLFHVPAPRHKWNMLTVGTQPVCAVDWLSVIHHSSICAFCHSVFFCEGGSPDLYQIHSCVIDRWERRSALKNQKKTFIPWPRHDSYRKGVCENVQFPHCCLDVSYRSWDESKNTCPCRNHRFPNLVHYQILESTRPAVSCFSGPDDAPR